MSVHQLYSLETVFAGLGERSVHVKKNFEAVSLELAETVAEDCKFEYK